MRMRAKRAFAFLRVDTVSLLNLRRAADLLERNAAVCRPLAVWYLLKRALALAVAWRAFLKDSTLALRADLRCLTTFFQHLLMAVAYVVVMLRYLRLALLSPGNRDPDALLRRWVVLRLTVLRRGLYDRRAVAIYSMCREKKIRVPLGKSMQRFEKVAKNKRGRVGPRNKTRIVPQAA